MGWTFSGKEQVGLLFFLPVHSGSEFWGFPFGLWLSFPQVLWRGGGAPPLFFVHILVFFWLVFGRTDWVVRISPKFGYLRVGASSPSKYQVSLMEQWNLAWRWWLGFGEISAPWTFWKQWFFTTPVKVDQS